MHTYIHFTFKVPHKLRTGRTTIGKRVETGWRAGKAAVKSRRVKFPAMAVGNRAGGVGARGQASGHKEEHVKVKALNISTTLLFFSFLAFPCYGPIVVV